MLIDYELARSGKRAEAGRKLAGLVARSHGAPIPDIMCGGLGGCW